MMMFVSLILFRISPVVAQTLAPVSKIYVCLVPDGIDILIASLGGKISVYMSLL